MDKRYVQYFWGGKDFQAVADVQMDPGMGGGTDESRNIWGTSQRAWDGHIWMYVMKTYPDSIVEYHIL